MNLCTNALLVKFRMDLIGNNVFGPGRNRRVAEIQIFEKTYLMVIKNETGLKFKINNSISDWVVRSKIGSIILKSGEITQCLQKTET